MAYEFALDLKVARRKSGLSQADCAHLLDVAPSRISKLESGKSIPNVVELCMLYLVLDKSVVEMCHDISTSTGRRLQKQLSSMPNCPKNWRGKYSRQDTLNALSNKLQALAEKENG